MQTIRETACGEGTYRRGRRVLYAAMLGFALMGAGCRGGQAVLTEQAEAGRLVGTLHVSFIKGNEATGRAVLADTDEASSAAADEARQSMTTAVQSFQKLQPLLASLGYTSEMKTAAAFEQQFTELRALDAEILPLAVENTNLKAQRLSFGEAQAAADTFAKAMRDAAARVGSARASATAESSVAGLLQMQVLQARHIAEADEASMTRMEGQMHEAEGVSLRGIASLRRLLVGKSDVLDTAEQAAERFLTVNQQIVDLSRRNTNVRSLALTLGRRRVVAAACEDQLRTLSEALNGHETRATR